MSSQLDYEALDILSDVWSQFSLECEGDWRNDGALSTLEMVADYLLEKGRLEKHPTRPWYRFTTLDREPL